VLEGVIILHELVVFQMTYAVYRASSLIYLVEVEEVEVVVQLLEVVVIAFPV
jgi:hypothetical protein